MCSLPLNVYANCTNEQAVTVDDLFSKATTLFPDAPLPERPSSPALRNPSSNDIIWSDIVTNDCGNTTRLDIYSDGACVLLEIVPDRQTRDNLTISNSGNSYTIIWSWFSGLNYHRVHLYATRLYSSSNGYYFQTPSSNSANATGVTITSVYGSGNPCRTETFHGNVFDIDEYGYVDYLFGLELNGYVSSAGTVTADYSYGICY